MVKNTKGGNKHKKQANSVQMQRPLELPDADQLFALVCKPMGHSKFAVKYINGIGDAQLCYDAIGIICGKLRKRRQWVIEGNFVLISKRDFERTKDKEKVDIIHVYKEYEINELKRRKLINQKLINVSNGSGNKFSNKDDDNEEFAEFCMEEEIEGTQVNKYKKQNKEETNYVDFSYMDNSDEDESDEEN